MAYTIDSQTPKVRRDAVIFANKHGVQTAWRRYGGSPDTISKWRKKAEIAGLHPILARSSRPSEPAVDQGKIRQYFFRRKTVTVPVYLNQLGVCSYTIFLNYSTKFAIQIL